MIRNWSRRAVTLLCGLVTLGYVAALPAAAATADCLACDKVVVVDAESLPRDGLVKVNTLPGNYSVYALMKAGQLNDLVVKDGTGRVCRALGPMSSSTWTSHPVPRYPHSYSLVTTWIRFTSGKKCFKLPLLGKVCPTVQIKRTEMAF